MKKKLYLLPLAALLLCASVSAQQSQQSQQPQVSQQVNIDSLALLAQIGQDQLQLGKLQNMVCQKTKNKQGAATDAQNSASDNMTAAEKLNDDPDNKKLAKNASNKADEAKNDAKKSRKESGKLNDLNKEIMDLKIKIAGEQSKMNVYSPTVAIQPNTAVPMSAKPDTTQHP
jgi:hypothetical protein